MEDTHDFPETVETRLAVLVRPEDRDMRARELTPREIVAELDKYIIGQDAAKRAVAIALRNRYRRRLLSGDLREEIIPKNILMIGPTGVGKTEIARRLSALANAPFVKVEATKYTEVGYVGRDVESMVRDLVETAIRMLKAEKLEAVQEQGRELAVDRIVEILQPMPASSSAARNPMQAIFETLTHGGTPPASPGVQAEELDRIRRIRERLRKEVASGALDDREIELEVEDTHRPTIEVFSSATGFEEVGFSNLQDLLGSMLPHRTRKKRVKVSEAREILAEQQAQALLDPEEIAKDAIIRAEESGIVFIDEIDKIAGHGSAHGPDVSREGVQRDILPIVEGSTVQTKHGPVRTDHVLFIAAGAFHMSKPSDLIPELQGRLPIRVELDSLGEADFVRILTEPQNALLRQATALLATEGVEVRFARSAISEIARCAALVNERMENIGARRLHTILERVLEDISFRAPELNGKKITIDRAFIRKRLRDALASEDLSRYIL